ncbi:MAG: LacI family DNA-binding transcriptional regulator [Eubacteriales bacterium]
MVTIKDIALRVGKTEAAVSMALNNKAGVSEDTKKLIQKIAEEMGYTPNIIARGLSTKKSSVVGLVIPDLDNPYYSRFASWVNTHLQSKGLQLMLAVSNQNAQSEQSIVMDFIARRVEGIIIAPVTEDMGTADYSETLLKSRIPFAFATSYYKSWTAPCVMCDLQEGERLVYEYLLEIGHRKILLLGTDKESMSTALRLEGAHRACRERGLNPEDVIELQSVKYPNFEDAYRFVKDKIKIGYSFTAVTTINDIMALGALKALSEASIRVPGDISLCGYDNLLFSEISSIPLTTVEQDLNSIAECALDIILGKGNKNKCKNTIYTIIPRLIIRESTNAPHT